MTEVAHLVLARKYRPRVFKEVVEQGLAVTALKNAADHGRIGSAYLFSGARGTGKTTIARILAKRVNCLNPKDSEPCCECESCVSIQNGSSLDVQEIDAASNRSIDNIRDLRENVKFQPMNAKRKVYIIDEVHMLTPEAFNALLKTLEEPPEHVLFVLATTELNKIPETILSRCQTFAFRKVPLNILQNHLKDICNREKIKAEDEALFWIARRGDGSVRDSLSFLEQSITYTEGNVTTGKVKELIGALPLDLYLGLIQMLLDPKTKFPDLVEPVHRRFDEGADLRRFIWDFLDLLRALSHVLHGVERPEFVGLPP
ncbi:MAG TPA: DNA polymerase III subunit gamma/tau, partial [Leptospiraceae bacterium]|nr:DNA polymerase III subunit gamma/tau [Leptospiraceae bacterium]